MKKPPDQERVSLDRHSTRPSHDRGHHTDSTAQNGSVVSLPSDITSVAKPHAHPGITDAKTNGTTTPPDVVNVDRNTIDPHPEKQSNDSPADTEVGAQEGTSPKKNKGTWFYRTYRTTRAILLHSYVNLLLVFVPAGIVVGQMDGVHAGVKFAVNSIAIVPLAGLLSHATESVAVRLGDTVGALLNVTFGNAVELIIFLALVQNKIRIVQASLLGSILANLLLILGMCFFLGGMRYREQIYNSTVTQMSACLLSLSVISLVLPTAFHASFSNRDLADQQSLKISRGTSVVLLLVYILYLLFQLKSHAYMYESTPQHIVDAEATPGPAASWLDSSSSESDSSSSDDSLDSHGSRDTMGKRVKRAFRSRRKRKASVSSVDSDVKPAKPTSRGSSQTSGDVEMSEMRHAGPSASVEDSDSEDASNGRRRGSFRHRGHKKKSRHHKSARRDKHVREAGPEGTSSEQHDVIVVDRGSNIAENRHLGDASLEAGEPRRVDFGAAAEEPSGTNTSTPQGGRRPFPTLRGISVKSLAPSVFVQQPADSIVMPAVTGPVPRVRYGIRRTNSLPDHLGRTPTAMAMAPSRIPLMSLTGGVGVENLGRTATGAASGVGGGDDDEEEDYGSLSRTASVILLLVSTALVALCAEYLVSSIEDVVKQGSVGEIFIGLIILPIVGNAAEHVTAITVALKNKMDLAIGVAVGSSIQIALFVTPLIVILGWMMDRDMTLYFTLFETVCLFVSTFIVNFLVLDGRSNYLEGALLCCTYVIIGLVAFFYPEEGLSDGQVDQLNVVSALGRR